MPPHNTKNKPKQKRRRSRPLLVYVTLPNRPVTKVDIKKEFYPQTFMTRVSVEEFRVVAARLLGVGDATRLVMWHRGWVMEDGKRFRDCAIVTGNTIQCALLLVPPMKQLLSLVSHSFMTPLDAVILNRFSHNHPILQQSELMGYARVDSAQLESRLRKLQTLGLIQPLRSSTAAGKTWMFDCVYFVNFIKYRLVAIANTLSERATAAPKKEVDFYCSGCGEGYTNTDMSSFYTGVGRVVCCPKCGCDDFRNGERPRHHNATNANADTNTDISTQLFRVFQCLKEIDACGKTYAADQAQQTQERVFSISEIFVETPPIDTTPTTVEEETISSSGSEPTDSETEADEITVTVQGVVYEIDKITEKLMDQMSAEEQETYERAYEQRFQ